MLVHLRRLSVQTLIYGLGGVATSLATLLLLPVYTHILSPQDYGKVAIVALVTSVVALFLDSGQRIAFFRFYSLYEDPLVRRRLISTVLIYLLVSSAVILIPLLFFLDRIVQLLFNDVSILPLARMALIGTFFDVGSVIPFSRFRAEQRPASYAILSVFRLLTNISLTILAIVVLHWGVEGVIYSNLTTSILFFIVCFGLVAGDVEWKVDFELLKRLLSFGLPLVPGLFGAWALTLSDRFFLQKFADISQVGIYALGYSIAGGLNMVTGWFNTAYAPYCYSLFNQADAKTIYRSVLTYSMTLFTLIGLGIAIFAREILVFLSKSTFYEAALIVPFIVLAYLFYELEYLTSFGFDLTGKTWFYAFIVGPAAVVNFLLNFLLIPRYGMMGAASATVLSYAVQMIIGYRIVRRVYPVNYEWGRLFKMAFVTVGVYFACMALKTGVVWVDLARGFLFILSWFLALYLLRFFTQSELSAGWSMAGKGLQWIRVYFPIPKSW